MYYKNTIITVCNFKKLKISQFATPSGSHKTIGQFSCHPAS